MTTSEAPPRWDLTPIFSGLDDRAFTGAVEGLYAGVDRLVALYEELDIRDTAPRPVTDADVAALESVLDATNELQDELRPLAMYLYALISTDSHNDAAARALRGAPDPGCAARAARQAARCVARGARRRRAHRALPARDRARVRGAQGGGGCRAPDERARGVARGRAGAVGVAGVATAARRRLVAAHGRGARGRRERRARADGVRAGSRRTPIRTGAAPRTKASSRRGRPSRCRWPRR